MKKENRANYVTAYMDDDRSVMILATSRRGEQMRNILNPDPRRCHAEDTLVHPARKDLSEQEKAVVRELCEKYPDRLSLSDYL